jgi:hypothetical protein
MPSTDQGHLLSGHAFPSRGDVMTIDPWVQREFYGKDGFPTFVLGESSFTKGKHGKRGDPLPPDWNQRIISSFLENGNDNTIKRMMDVFYDAPPLDREEHRKFWQSTVFANFIQTDMGEPGTPKTSEDWDGGKPVFHRYLRELQPQFILAVGFELWDNLPSEGRQEHHFGVRPPKGPTGKERPCLLYPNGNGQSFVCGIRHTSQGFSPKIWRSWVKHSIEEAHRLRQFI